MNPIMKQLAATHPQQDEIVLCRLGQHSFLAKFGEKLVAIDPYLTADPSRRIPPPVAPEELCGVVAILASHDHGDHLDRPALAAMAAASPEAKLIVPEAVRNSIHEFPAERIVGIDDRIGRELDGLRITGIAAAHEFFDRDAAGRYPYLGFVVRGNGVTLYHSGDCCVYDGLAGRIAPFAPEVMLLPINGRDAKRYTGGFIGNMTYQEAADFAGWLHCPLVIPGHYDMFAENCADPLPFAEFVRVKYPATRAVILAPGEIRLFSFRRPRVPENRRREKQQVGTKS